MDKQAIFTWTGAERRSGAWPLPARYILVLLLAIWLTPPLPASAQASTSVYLEDLTSTELRAAIQAGKTTIIVPVGGTEQNGPHMALGKHNERARILAGKIAAALGNALVAPVIAYVPEGGINPPVAHMRFPGTITLPDATFETLLEYAARSFKLHGFRDIVLLGDHGGYQRDLQAVATKLDREWAGGPARVHAIVDYYRVTETEYPQALKREGYRDAEIGTHAGLADTSLALAVDPQMVRAGALNAGVPLTKAEGVYGDPRRANAKAGQIGVDLIVTRTVAAIKTAVEHRESE